jgi:plastocyanin
MRRMRTRRFPRPTAALLGGLLAASLLAACGGSDSGGSDGGDEGDGGDDTSSDVAVFTGTNTLTWAEDSVSATAGEITIQLRNESNVQHNLYIVAPDGTENPKFLDSKRLGENPTETVNLTAGTYTIICKIPGHTNMKSKLVVS